MTRLSPKPNVHIYVCPEPSCGCLHIDFTDHIDHGDYCLVMDPGEARMFANTIVEVLDNPNAVTH